MKKILVTGASGFIGSHLIKELVKDFQVNCLVRKDLKFDHPNITIFKGDLLSPQAIKDSTREVSTIIHLAAQKYNTKDLEAMRKINVQGTKNLLRFAGDTHFIYISTWLAAYPQKTHYYGQTKKEAEDKVKKYGKKFTILRLPHIFGPSKTSLIFTKYLLPVYLLLRYRVRPIYNPIDIYSLCITIKKILGNKKYFKKSYYLVSSNRLIEII